MKKTIIITIIICFILTIIIFRIIPPKEEQLLTLGDKMSMGYTFTNIKGYSYNDYLNEDLSKCHHHFNYITDYSSPKEITNSLLLKLENNYQNPNSKYSLIQSISSSTIITIWLGMEELESIDINTDIIEEYYNRVTKIIKFIRNYNHNKIVIIGIYNYNKSDIINKYLKELSNKYNLIFIDPTIVENHPSFFFTNNNYELNYKGHNYIYKIIKSSLNITCNS